MNLSGDGYGAGCELVSEAQSLSGGLLSRRQALLACAVPALLTGTVQAQQMHGVGFWDRPRSVWLRRPATGEEIRSTYWANGALVEHEYRRLCWFLRDPKMVVRMEQRRRQGLAVPHSWYSAVEYNVVPLDVLYALGGWLDHFGMSRAIVLTSAFRHPLTNAATEGAALSSHHTRGAAVDVVVPGVPAEQVGRFSQWLRAGGVGFYPSRHFTHVDAGRLRSWRG